MLVFRNAAKSTSKLSPFLCSQRANAHTEGGRRLNLKSLEAQGDTVVRELERIKLLEQHKLVDFDLWGLPLDLLDLRVPVSIFTRGTTIKQIWASFEHNLSNKISNSISMHRIAKSHSFPWDSTLKPFSYQVFRTASTRPKTWLEPLRDIGLSTYKELNAAIARGHTPTVNQLTKGLYRQRALERTKALHRGSSKSLNWTLHSLSSPVQCVSIRTLQGHYGPTEPKFGTRWFVQACLKFDSLQSISTRASTTQPEPKRVLEYLVFEKRMWFDEPWTIRDQLWEVVHSKNSGEKV